MSIKGVKRATHYPVRRLTRGEGLYRANSGSLGSQLAGRNEDDYERYENERNKEEKRLSSRVWCRVASGVVQDCLVCKKKKIIECGFLI